MFTVRVISKFSSAHNLRKYKGKCEALHGHNWRVEVGACSDDLDDIGMVVDFKELKALLGEVLGSLDHKHLNEVEPFTEINPTSENIAKFIFESIQEKKKDFKLEYVTVWETDTSSATYSE